MPTKVLSLLSLAGDTKRSYTPLCQPCTKFLSCGRSVVPTKVLTLLSLAVDTKRVDSPLCQPCTKVFLNLCCR